PRLCDKRCSTFERILASRIRSIGLDSRSTVGTNEDTHCDYHVLSALWLWPEGFATHGVLSNEPTPSRSQQAGIALIAIRFGHAGQPRRRRGSSKTREPRDALSRPSLQ